MSLLTAAAGSNTPSWTFFASGTGIVVGAVLTVLGTLWLQERARRAERQVRREQRHLERHAAQQAFERDVLVELQDQLSIAGRAASALNHAHEMAYRQTQRFARDPLDDDYREFPEILRRAVERIDLLRVRLLDDGLRARVAEYVAMVNEAEGGMRAGRTDAQMRADADQSLVRMVHGWPPLRDELGAAVRATFDPPPELPADTR